MKTKHGIRNTILLAIAVTAVATILSVSVTYLLDVDGFRAFIIGCVFGYPAGLFIAQTATKRGWLD